MSSSSSSARYAPLGQRTDRELDEAFESDEDDDDANYQDALTESTPLTRAHRTNDDDTHNDAEPTSAIPGAYDFERDRAYDHPPPGSPPRPSARALPNDYGNSNGLLPSTPARPAPPRASFLRRAAGALLPSHYVRIPNSDAGSSTRPVVGTGTDNDGVFANVTAKPQRARTVAVEAADGSGNVYMVPEDSNQKEVPPSYAAAQADSAPPYYETTVHAGPTSSGVPCDANGDMLIDDLPVGAAWLFASNLFISFFFQFVGFVFTYLLHTSHAAKYGSRAGLGLTLIQYGFYSRTGGDGDDFQDGTGGGVGVGRAVGAGSGSGSGSGTPSTPGVAQMPDDAYMPSLSITSKDWLAFLFMTLGWFLLLSSCIGFLRVKRWERSLRAAEAQAPRPASPGLVARDLAVRRNIAAVFGIGLVEEEMTPAEADEQERAEDERLTRDLRAAGLL
ncbi:hypothetical protein H0H81_011761 [Sphagnurus paluster]|uniref:Metal homeostatis protein bsd2 n=1 Tax=Sphagnurus paluster TaxID=117069 RepID=A0A9P7GHA7_9AGAR|nr:hypothetical protein H0H81_011761 [Sphagnurus paluster]